jgi:hypothetical protein
VRSDNELLDKYNFLKDKKNIILKRFKICPLNVESNDERRMVITDEHAKKMKDDVIGTALMYSDDGINLPSYHEDSKGNRKVLGSAIGSDIITDSNGLKYLVGDYVIYTDANTDILDKLQNSDEDNIGASYEIKDAYTDLSTGEIIDGSFKGLSVMDRMKSAFQHHALLVASKEREEEMEIKYDEMMKTIIGEDYNNKISEKEKLIENLNKSIEESKNKYQEELNSLKTYYENQIEMFKEETSRLRELNENLI